jgi:hypothetical protein
VERLIARPTLGISEMEGAQVEAVDGVADEICQVPFGQPVLPRVGQQPLLLRIVLAQAVSAVVCQNISIHEGFQR